MSQPLRNPRTGSDSSSRFRLTAVEASPGTDGAFALSGERITIGSAPDNDLRIADHSVSRLHALLERSADGYRVSDRGSTNGTYVNGRRIGVAVALRDGDEVRFGARGYRLVREAHQPIPAPGRGGVKAVTAIAALAAIAVTAFVVVRRMLPGDQAARQSGAGGGEVSPPPAPLTNPSEAPARVREALAPKDTTEEPELPTLRPTPAVSAEALAEARSWLKPMNYYRELAGLAPVAPDPALEAGLLAHTRYLVKNDAANIKASKIGLEAHTEDPSNPWYSKEGLMAGRASDVEEGYQPNGQPWISPEIAIGGWISTPFHRLAILNPNLRAAGYGQFCEDGLCAAGLNLLTDMDAVAMLPQTLAKPIMFPPDGSTLPLKSWEGEWPSPLTACPGYVPPSGLAITLQLGLTLAVRMTDFKVTREDRGPSAVEACGFDSTTYVNPDPAAQQRARKMLTGFGAVVIVPRDPLEAGRYTVALTADDRRYAWSFTISP